MEIISLLLLHGYTVLWQIAFLKNFQPLPLWYFLVSWYTYHILFIISSLTVFAEPHRIALSWHCLGGTQQKTEHIFSLLSRAEKKNRRMENYEMWLIFFLNGLVLSLLTSSLRASSYCVHSILLSSGFSHRLFLSFPVKCS